VISIERLYRAVGLPPRDLDPATVADGRGCFSVAPSQMAKKLAEEAIEVVIDAGPMAMPQAVVRRKSADLLYKSHRSVGPRPACVPEGRLARDGAARTSARPSRRSLPKVAPEARQGAAAATSPADQLSRSINRGLRKQQ